MIIERYSNDGFQPKIQTHQKQYLKMYTEEFKPMVFKNSDNFDISEEFLEMINNNNYTDYLKNRDFIIKNQSDFNSGIWCFKNGFSDEFYLNHMKIIEKRNIAYIPDDTIGYIINGLFFKESGKIIDLFKISKEVYIPEKNLENLIVIKKKTN